MPQPFATAFPPRQLQTCQLHRRNVPHKSNTLKFNEERLRFARLRAADSRSEHLSRKKCDKGNELRYVSAPARIGRASRGVAQLAERRSPKPKVGGSRPSAPAKHCLHSLGRTPAYRQAGGQAGRRAGVQIEVNRLAQIGATTRGHKQGKRRKRK